MKCRKWGMNGLDDTILPTCVSAYYRYNSCHPYTFHEFHAQKNNNFKT